MLVGVEVERLDEVDESLLEFGRLFLSFCQLAVHKLRERLFLLQTVIGSYDLVEPVASEVLVQQALEGLL